MTSPSRKLFTVQMGTSHQTDSYHCGPPPKVLTTKDATLTTKDASMTTKDAWVFLFAIDAICDLSLKFDYGISFET